MTLLQNEVFYINDEYIKLELTLYKFDRVWFQKIFNHIPEI